MIFYGGSGEWCVDCWARVRGDSELALIFGNTNYMYGPCANLPGFTHSHLYTVCAYLLTCQTQGAQGPQWWVWPRGGTGSNRKVA